MPDKLWVEAVVAIAAANPRLTEVLTDAPAALPACLQLLARCPRVTALTVSRLECMLVALGDLRGGAAALAARRALPCRNLGREAQDVESSNGCSGSFVRAVRTTHADGEAHSLRATLAAVGAGAWHVRELHLPGCKRHDGVLVSLLGALTTAATQHACGLQRLVLHYSYAETQKPMSAAAGHALAAAVEALPSLCSITFSDETDPRGSRASARTNAGVVEDYLLETVQRGGSPQLTPGGKALVDALAHREPRLLLFYTGTPAYDYSTSQLLY